MAVGVVSAATNVVRVARYEEFGFCERRADSFVGANEDIFIRLAEMNNWTLEWVECSSAEAARKLKAGEIDLMGGMSYTAEREQNVLYSHLSMGEYGSELVVHAGSDVDWLRKGTEKELVVATAHDARINQLLENFLQTQGIRYRLVKCESFQEARRVFYLSQAEAVVTIGPFDMPGERVLAVLPPVMGFIGVSKRREDLLREVDRSMLSLHEDSPFFFHNLMRGHFPAVASRGDTLTHAERQWLRERVAKGVPVRVDISPVMPPMKLWNARAHEPKGFTKALFDEIGRRTGLLFAFEEPVSESEARARFRSGKVDVWTDFGLASNDALVDAEHRVDLMAQQLLVCRRDCALEDPCAGIISVPAWDHARLANYRHANMMKRTVICPTTLEAVRAVLDGRADGMFLSAFMASILIRELKAERELGTRPATRPHEEVNFSFAISPKSPPELASVLRKTLDGFSHDDLAAIMMQGTYESISHPLLSTKGWMLLSVGVLAVLVGLIGFRDVRKARRQEAKIEEHARLVKLRDSFFERVTKELSSPIDNIEAKAECLRTPAASREHVLEWTEGLIRNVDDLVNRLRQLVEYSKLKREYENKWRQAGGGGSFDN